MHLCARLLAVGAIGLKVAIAPAPGGALGQGVNLNIDPQQLIGRDVISEKGTRLCSVKEVIVEGRQVSSWVLDCGTKDVGLNPRNVRIVFKDKRTITIEAPLTEEMIRGFPSQRLENGRVK